MIRQRPAIYKRPAGLHLLLALVISLSFGYYAAGVAALREEFFHAARYARAPFDVADDGQSLSTLRPEAQKAGLRKGDALLSWQGVPFTGWAQVLKSTRTSRPGEILTVSVRTSKGSVQTFQFPFHTREGPDFSLGGLIAFLVPIIGVPLISLLVGYWVVAARPRDLNAWLVLGLLTGPETFFGNLDWTFWPSPWWIVFGLWNVFVQQFILVALLWFGIRFPERWRLDRRFPWAKWLVLGMTIASFLRTLCIFYVKLFRIPAAPSLLTLDQIFDRVISTLSILCLVLFLAAVFDKVRSASTPDARRRLQVLATGSTLSLGPLTLLFGLGSYFGVELNQGNWFIVIIPLFSLFPLTLAYVVIVQRALDVPVLLRMGTKYLLARATLILLEIALLTFLIFRFVLPLIQAKQHTALNLFFLVLACAALIRMFVMREGLGTRLQRWLDRQFFREAYNTEVVLSELSEEARRYTEKGPLIDTVLRRLSEVLHVPQIAILLPAGGSFHLERAFGLNAASGLMLSQRSATVQHLLQTQRPATVYPDRPAEWLSAANPEERDLLLRINAELLLPLPGRAGLMGLVALGPKKSEEPYTPTDLRILQSVAAQTGLALEVSDLAQSLAQEALVRERLNREIEIAREVQQRLFPQRLPQLPGVSLAGFCRPALGVGGDYYDVFELEDGRLGLAIGDVSGKGISAALLMASLRASLRGLMIEGPVDLARMMQKVNRLVYEASASHRYATFFFATYELRTRELVYVNAGHNPPFLLRGDRQEICRLEAGGVVVGLLPVAAYEAQSIAVEPGDLLITYTDGISEAMTADDEEWGEDRMIAALPATADASASAVLDRIFEAADAFTAGAEQHDDMTLLVMKVAT